MRRKGGKETGLVRQVLDYLHYRKVWAYRNNTGALRDKTGRPVFFGAKGSPDIIARLRTVGYGFSGRVIHIECKSEKGKQSDYQKEWQTLAEAHGDVYILARTLEDVKEVFG